MIDVAGAATEQPAAIVGANVATVIAMAGTAAETPAEIDGATGATAMDDAGIETSAPDPALAAVSNSTHVIRATSAILCIELHAQI